MVCLAPRAPGDSVPRVARPALTGASVRPLNFTVRFCTRLCAFGPLGSAARHRFRVAALDYTDMFARLSDQLPLQSSGPSDRKEKPSSQSTKGFPGS